jgi:hypothetical protein
VEFRLPAAAYLLDDVLGAVGGTVAVERIAVAVERRVGVAR